MIIPWIVVKWLVLSRNLAPEDLVVKRFLSCHSSFIFRMSHGFYFTKLCVVYHMWMLCEIFPVMQTAFLVSLNCAFGFVCMVSDWNPGSPTNAVWDFQLSIHTVVCAIKMDLLYQKGRDYSATTGTCNFSFLLFNLPAAVDIFHIMTHFSLAPLPVTGSFQCLCSFKPVSVFLKF